jgi:hypothetical protein
MPTESSPRCKSCAPERRGTFTAEIAIHFRGLEGLDKPIVWVFPNIRICLDCGTAEFSVPTRELQVLATGSPVDGALISIMRKTEKAS